MFLGINGSRLKQIKIIQKKKKIKIKIKEAGLIFGFYCFYQCPKKEKNFRKKKEKRTIHKTKKKYSFAFNQNLISINEKHKIIKRKINNLKNKNNLPKKYKTRRKVKSESH